MAEKADYLQIGGSNINIYSKNKGLCLGAGVLTIGQGVTNIFVMYLGGIEIFSSGIVGGGGKGRKNICTSHENEHGPPPGNKWLVPKLL